MSEILSPILFSESEVASIDSTVILPLGGLATRALEITDDHIPKHLIKVNETNCVLDIVLGGLQSVGFSRFVFCLGHHRDQLKEYLSTSDWIINSGVEFEISEETNALGVDGAIIHAINNLGLKGNAVIVPGDMFLPWEGVVDLTSYHKSHCPDVTIGVTSHVTDYTTDVGNMIIEMETNRLIWCYGREDSDKQTCPNGAQELTSAAATAIHTERYVEICDRYTAQAGDTGKPLSFRDQVARWAIRQRDIRIEAFDLEGEILDMGTPDAIYHGQTNWRQYVRM